MGRIRAPLQSKLSNNSEVHPRVFSVIFLRGGKICFPPKKKKKKKKLPGEKYFSPTGLILRDRPGPVICDRYWVGG